jgi:hypothetical protein
MKYLKIAKKKKETGHCGAHLSSQLLGRMTQRSLSSEWQTSLGNIARKQNKTKRKILSYSLRALGSWIRHSVKDTRCHLPAFCKEGAGIILVWDVSLPRVNRALKDNLALGEMLSSKSQEFMQGTWEWWHEKYNLNSIIVLILLKKEK